jgi:DNA (cytosine-5)-methyltransferase 1
MVGVRPRLLDLFCGAGGASVGYHRAGFDVVGVDNVAKVGKHYPFEFHEADALEYLAEHGHEFDVVHASPPCQDHSALSALVGKHGTGWLLEATRDALHSAGPLYVIENVASAKLPVSMLLCGSMFGLRTYRHRKFEIDLRAGLLMVPEHPTHRVLTSTKKRRACWDAGLNISVTGDIGSTIGGLALGIDWMNGNELSQAIPPAYCEFIGAQLVAALRLAS